jgi:hypothetical protein
MSVPVLSGIDTLKMVTAETLYDDTCGAPSRAPDRRDEPQQWSRSQDVLE